MLAVGDRSPTVPRAQNRHDRRLQLRPRVRRYRRADVVLHGLPAARPIAVERLGERRAFGAQRKVGHGLVDDVRIGAEDDLGESPLQSPRHVQDELRLARGLGEGDGRVAADAEVEDRLHHAGH